MNRECSELLRGRDIMKMTESSQSQRRTSVRASTPRSGSNRIDIALSVSRDEALSVDLRFGFICGVNESCCEPHTFTH